MGASCALIPGLQARDELGRQLGADVCLNQVVHRRRIRERRIELSRRIRHDLEETERADR